MTQNFSNMSMLEVAENLMLRKKTPQSFKKIAQEVSELMGLTEDELRQRVTRFYADLTLSGKFVNVSSDKWDLKNRQKYDVFENQFIFDSESSSGVDNLGNQEDVEDLDEEEIEEDFEEDYDGDEDL
ncbi:DNA-directed RNA polymerase subunit delta [Mycoplasmatota bacterium]|nr:DNA-directed RNA polymerase subunit delta [Mycoplasmatota bacterium]